ncbi:hypothetical protein KGMB02408_35170 [Bacteroides faecalis]|uniref:Uncharacterized protein n=1 Tax=Bacteroides faecalis TaxID=2447885 RepID=A0A401LYI6_9BACE|nr:hypothetical protein KGMB02408_35170 [Bacteroides faecalis]
MGNSFTCADSVALPNKNSREIANFLFIPMILIYSSQYTFYYMTNKDTITTKYTSQKVKENNAFQ